VDIMRGPHRRSSVRHMLLPMYFSKFLCRYPVLAAQFLLPFDVFKDSGGAVWAPLSIMAFMMLVRLTGSQVMVSISALVAFISILPCILFMAWGIKDTNVAAITRTTGEFSSRPAVISL
jgi:hypothetical protein